MAVTLSLDSDNNGKTVDVFIVSSSAPTCTSTHSEVEWEAYYDALSAALARRPPNAIVIIGLGADTNASIGRGKLSDNDIESSVVGCFGIERINDAGRRLRVFMETHQIAALSTFFNKFNKKYYSTWTHSVSKCAYQIQIDHSFTLRENLRHFDLYF